MKYKLVGKFKSMRSGQIYEVKKNEAGDLSCNCPGWINHRNCKHISWIIEKGEMGFSRKFPNFLEAQEMDFGKNTEKVKVWEENNKEDIIPLEL